MEAKSTSYWTPGCGWNYELGSVHPSVLPSGSFLRIGSLVFSETQHGVRGQCIVVCDRTRFFEKNIFAQKIGQKWAKIGLFKFIGKFCH